MKATELMIGDLVCLKDDIKCELPLKIDGVLTNDISLEGEGFLGGAEGLIRPIPITPEMLVKNGFYNRNTQWYYKRFGSYVCFDIAISLVYREIEVSKVCGAGTDCEEEEYGSSIVFGNDICVHELQHALRLCGLNEIADNFKV